MYIPRRASGREEGMGYRSGTTGRVCGRRPGVNTVVTVRGQLWAPEGSGEQWQDLGSGSERQSHGRIIGRSMRRWSRWFESRGNMAVILDPSFFLTSSPLSNQCIYLINHLNPAPFYLIIMAVVQDIITSHQDYHQDLEGHYQPRTLTYPSPLSLVSKEEATCIHHVGLYTFVSKP